MTDASSYVTNVFNGVWLGRLAIGMVSTAVTTFGVAHYVVRANTMGLETALAAIAESQSADRESQNAADAGLQSSLDLLNGTSVQVLGQLQALNTTMTGLERQSSTQMAELTHLREDLAKVQDAVQEAGIDLRASAQVGGGRVIDTAQLGQLRDELGISEDTPVLLLLLPTEDYPQGQVIIEQGDSGLREVIEDGSAGSAVEYGPPQDFNEDDQAPQQGDQLQPPDLEQDSDQPMIEQPRLEQAPGEPSIEVQPAPLDFR